MSLRIGMGHKHNVKLSLSFGWQNAAEQTKAENAGAQKYRCVDTQPQNCLKYA